MVLLFAGINHHFTFLQTATCFTWFLLLKVMLFNTVQVWSGVSSFQLALSAVSCVTHMQQ